MFIDFICGQCARKQGYTLDERKEMALNLEQGENECECGRIIVWKNKRLIVITNRNKSILEG